MNIFVPFLWSETYCTEIGVLSQMATNMNWINSSCNVVQLLKPLYGFYIFLKPSWHTNTCLLALFSKGFDLSLDLISLKETKMLQVLKVKVHVYLVSPTKYELWLDKRQLNVAFCASDISCNRKMGLSLKIYDMPYWTWALSAPHPSNQPPESVSNAHHSLMNMINPNVGSLWTPFKVPPLHKHIPFANHQVFWHSVNTLVFTCQQKRQ